MEINEIIAQLKDKFGDSLDATKATALLKGMDLSKFSFAEIVEKVKEHNLLSLDLDGDGKSEGIVDELKGVAGKMFGGMFGK